MNLANSLYQFCTETYQGLSSDGITAPDRIFPTKCWLFKTTNYPKMREPRRIYERYIESKKDW